MESTNVKKRKTSTPPDGYVCKLCDVAGHWIQQCPKKQKKKRKPSTHVPIPGQDPSPEDIARARALQKMTPPPCQCGITSRLKKVKRSKFNDQSRAIGKYFFFCSKARHDATKCRFAQPVEEARPVEEE